MNTPTANILVAFNKETMGRLFSDGATYKSLVAELSDSDNAALLFNNVANPNFVSFEHSVGIDKFQMTLTFIDPKEEFESRFFTNNPARIIGGFSNPEAEHTGGFITNKPADVEQSQADYSKEFVAKYKEELENSIGEREIYVAYGTGNNLDLWSGPHRTVLINADVTVKGARKITLTMAPTPNAFDISQRRGAYNEKINLNLQGLRIRHEGVSQLIKFTEGLAYNPLPNVLYGGHEIYKDTGIKYSEETKQALVSAGYEQLANKLEKYDFHAMVVDTLRNYIQQATSNKNVIVLLPDLNVVCRQAINDEAKKFDLLETSATAAAESLFLAGSNFLGGFANSYIKDQFDPYYSTLGKEKKFLEATLHRFGLRLHERRTEFEKTLNAIANGQLGYMQSLEDAPREDAAAAAHFDLRRFYAVLDKTERQVPDHRAVVETVLSKIKEMSAESYKMSTTAYMTETDTNVLSLWGQAEGGVPWSVFYPFGGHDDFTENSNAIIVGDLALIKEYLYGGVDLEAKKKSINDLKDKATQQAAKHAKALLAGLGNSFLGNTSGVAQNIKTLTEEPTKGDYQIAAALQHPIHPLDKIALLNVRYNREIRELVNPVTVMKGAGAFGDISYLPDDFAHQDEDFSDQQKRYIEEEGIPVFRYNTQNPNVVDMKFKFGGIYFALLKMGYQKEIKRLASGVAEGILPTGIGTFPIRTRGAAIAYLRSKGFSQGMGDPEKQEIISNLASRISPELTEELNVDSAEAAADSLQLEIQGLEQSNLRGLLLVDQELPGNPNSILADMSEDLYRKALQMSITTLPTFHISRLSSLSSPCIVFAQDQPIMQSARSERKVINKFFSGLYKIMGFKHSITTSAATSEFKLVKNAPNFEETDQKKEVEEIDG